MHRLFPLALVLASITPGVAGTVAHWRFEGDAAGFVADSGGSNRTLTLAGGTAAPAQVSLTASGAGSKFHHPLPQNGAANAKAASFDGGDRATATDDDAFTGTTFTVEAYLHATSVGTSTKFIAGHFDSSAAAQRSWALVIASGRLSLYLSANGSSFENIASNFTIEEGRDYYVAASVDVANLTTSGITLYVQDLTAGTPLAGQTFSHSTTAVLNAAAPFSIGATANGTSPFHGLIDEVRVSDARLGIAQLLAVDPANPPPEPETPPLPVADGFKGIWYSNGPTGNQYAYKYSGGMATYPQQHMPIALYSAAVHKTFFVYGGTGTSSTGPLLHMISYYDHATRRVARPRILLNKATDDAHDNPVLSIDDAGHLWIFSNTHGDARRAYLHRSTAPYSIERFEEVALPTDVFPQSRFSYGEPWWVPGSGFLFLHIRYNSGQRDLYWTTSADGVNWTPRGTLSQMLNGQYQISSRTGSRVGTAFNVHPPVGGLDARTNLYYLETPNLGTDWRNAAGTAVTPPLLDPANAALVRDYMSEGRLVYLKDLDYDAAGRPVIFYLTAANSSPGPQTPTRMLHTARWTGAAWEFRDAMPTDHNYDYGSLSIEADGTWRVIGTFFPGPQAFGTGGEMGIWTSADQGASWQLAREVTSGSALNHNYPRRVRDGREDFHALWADGNAFVASASSLYFTDRHGDAVLRLPTTMNTDLAFPEVVRIHDPGGDPDGDGADNENEFTAGTDPRDPGSVLRVETLAPPAAAGAGVRLTFGTRAGKRYRVVYRESLTAGTWLVLHEDVPGTGGAVMVEDPDSPGKVQRFYRVEVIE